MKTSRSGRRNFFSLTLGVYALYSVTLSSAQAQTTTSVAPAHDARSVAVAPVHPAATSAKARTEEDGASKGMNTGIKVHGHWLIEVKNPDGKLITHREFENSLASGSNCCGDRILAGLVGGVLNAPSWLILLEPDSGADTQIAISQTTGNAATSCNNFAQLEPSQISCSTNLLVTVPESSNPTVITGGTVTFSGSGTVPPLFPASIGYVATADFPTSGLLGNPGGIFTSRTLDGKNGDPPAVQVVPGQTVAVTVTISFQ